MIHIFVNELVLNKQNIIFNKKKNIDKIGKSKHTCRKKKQQNKLYISAFNCNKLRHAKCKMVIWN